MTAILTNADVRWLIWRPVLAGVASLKEVSVQWSCEDLAECHRAMDAKEAILPHLVSKVKK